MGENALIKLTKTAGSLFITLLLTLLYFYHSSGKQLPSGPCRPHAKPQLSHQVVAPTLNGAKTKNVTTKKITSKPLQADFAKAGINPKVLRLGLRAYSNARKKGVAKRPILTIVDYTKPSTARRLWVLDLRRHRVLFNDYVTHGKNSGGKYAKSFSNALGSLKSSLGVFLTESTYQGKHGYSLKIRGLDKRFNNKAEERSVVFHKSNYATERYLKQRGQLGRSWGCFAVSPKIASSLISTIKDGSLVFAYYPDPSWLRTSKFLH